MPPTEDTITKTKPKAVSPSNPSNPSNPPPPPPEQDKATEKAEEVKTAVIDSNIAATGDTSLEDKALVNVNAPPQHSLIDAQARLDAAKAELELAQKQVVAAEELASEEEEIAEEFQSRLDSIGGPQPYFVYDRDTKVPCEVIAPGENGLAGSVNLRATVAGESRIFLNVREDPAGIEAGTFHLRDKKKGRLVPSGGIFNVTEEEERVQAQAQAANANTSTSTTSTTSTAPQPLPSPQSNVMVPVE